MKSTPRLDKSLERAVSLLREEDTDLWLQAVSWLKGAANCSADRGVIVHSVMLHDDSTSPPTFSLEPQERLRRDRGSQPRPPIGHGYKCLHKGGVATRD